MKETKFKQTEVGMIPSDWNVKKIGEVCSITTGSQNTQDHDENGKYPFFVRSQEVERINKYIYDTEGVVTAGDGVGTGKIFHYVNGKFGLHQRCYLMYDFDKSTSVKYFYWVFSRNFYDRVHSMTAKSSVDSVRREMIADMQIALPPIEEQKRIAQALSDVDAVISTTEKLIAKKKALKQGAMQTLLSGKMRIQNGKWIKTTHFKQTELGPIPQDWETKPMESLIKDISDGPFGSNLKTEHYTSKQEARIVQLSNVGEDGWNDENVKYTTFSHAKDLARCIVPYGAIIIAKMMPAGRSIICPDDEKMYILGSDCVKFIPNDSLNSKYFIYFSKCDFYLKQIADNTQGSTRARTSVSKLKKIQVLLPSKPEQTAIATVLSDMDSEIAALETKLAKYRQLKTGMMQQLLTGKIRLV